MGSERIVPLVKIKTVKWVFSTLDNKTPFIILIDKGVGSERVGLER